MPAILFDLGVIRFQLLIADGPIGEAGAGNRSEHRAFFEITFVEAPEIGGEMRAAAADDARVDERVAHSRALRSLVRIIAESLRARERTVGDAAQIAVFEFIVLEIAGPEPRSLFEHDDTEAGLRQLARHDPAGSPRPNDDEVYGLTGFELSADQGERMLA